MASNYFTPIEEREKIFCTELVKYGVKYEKAVIAARILASGRADDFLSPSEIEIAKDACQKWSVQNKRLKRLKATINKI
ncbi:hypothetical protein [Nostoc punctiforme]|uniref:Uncharacterized protein n=1 Tax=Nostoc punctiforme (strain ATCC 29133 / PCC 73102) TaxID=63737 RepID=B2IYV4_NOSP7|nr:hypothetical protein [Nostoc punctiforme]ACC81687.1 conserved hypothetical protein [Nostoc punctiforme PCC 73102]